MVVRFIKYEISLYVGMLYLSRLDHHNQLPQIINNNKIPP